METGKDGGCWIFLNSLEKDKQKDEEGSDTWGEWEDGSVDLKQAHISIADNTLTNSFCQLWQLWEQEASCFQVHCEYKNHPWNQESN